MLFNLSNSVGIRDRGRDAGSAHIKLRFTVLGGGLCLTTRTCCVGMNFAGQRGVGRSCDFLNNCIRNNCFITPHLRLTTHCSVFGHGNASSSNFLGVPTMNVGCFFEKYGLGLRTVCRCMTH